MTGGLTEEERLLLLHKSRHGQRPLEDWHEPIRAMTSTRARSVPHLWVARCVGLTINRGHLA